MWLWAISNVLNCKQSHWGSPQPTDSTSILLRRTISLQLSPNRSTRTSLREKSCSASSKSENRSNPSMLVHASIHSQSMLLWTSRREIFLWFEDAVLVCSHDTGREDGSLESYREGSFWVRDGELVARSWGCPEGALQDGSGSQVH